MIKKVMNFIKEEEGAGLAEYALLLVLNRVLPAGLLLFPIRQRNSH